MEKQASGEYNVLCERVIEHEIVIPKRVVREEVIEKVMIVPETVVREEIVDEVQKVVETIVEIAKPVKQERIVEVPQVQYRDKIVEVVEKVKQKKITEVPKIEYHERYVEVPKYVDFEGNVIDAPEIEMHENVIERIVEVPEIQEKVTICEVTVPKYIEKVITPDKSTSINIPVPIEAVTTYDYQLRHPTPVINEVDYEVIAPRFIEVPINAQFFEPNQMMLMQQIKERIQEDLDPSRQPSLLQVERLMKDIDQMPNMFNHVNDETFRQNFVDAWKSGQITMITRD